MKECTLDELKIMMSDLKKSNKKMYSNYFNNLETMDTKIYYVCEEKGIVFWGEENDIPRTFFYCASEEVLERLLRIVPDGNILDIISREKEECRDVILRSGFHVYATYGRMTGYFASEETKRKVGELINNIVEMGYYKKENTFFAKREDAEFILNKLEDIFDPVTAHLCTYEELCTFIDKKWVFVYKEGKEIKGFYIIKQEGCKQYGYQIWNGTGVEAAYSLNLRANEETKAKGDITYGYSWVDIDNKKAVRFNRLWGSEFDGLYDVVYKK